MIVLFFALLLVMFTMGCVAGYLVAATRTDRLIAGMTPTELRALEGRVLKRRILAKRG